jgi:hypothetical protein
LSIFALIVIHFFLPFSMIYETVRVDSCWSNFYIYSEMTWLATAMAAVLFILALAREDGLRDQSSRYERNRRRQIQLRQNHVNGLAAGNSSNTGSNTNSSSQAGNPHSINNGNSNGNNNGRSGSTNIQTSGNHRSTTAAPNVGNGGRTSTSANRRSQTTSSSSRSLEVAFCLPTLPFLAILLAFLISGMRLISYSQKSPCEDAMTHKSIATLSSSPIISSPLSVPPNHANQYYTPMTASSAYLHPPPKSLVCAQECPLIYHGIVAYVLSLATFLTTLVSLSLGAQPFAQWLPRYVPCLTLTIFDEQMHGNRGRLSWGTDDLDDSSGDDGQDDDEDDCSDDDDATKTLKWVQEEAWEPVRLTHIPKEVDPLASPHEHGVVSVTALKKESPLHEKEVVMTIDFCCICMEDFPVQYGDREHGGQGVGNEFSKLTKSVSLPTPSSYVVMPCPDMRDLEEAQEETDKVEDVELGDGTVVRTIACGHVFHRGCIACWVERVWQCRLSMPSWQIPPSMSCPICRQDLSVRTERHSFSL